jgi:regulator of protease activity HflC (stomatin/prohibitin superfamily)
MGNNERSSLIYSRDDDSTSSSSNNWFGGLQGGFIAVLILVILGFGNTFSVISPGEVGIAITFGSYKTLDPGLHVITPFITKVHTLSTKSSTLETQNTVPTAEGLAVNLNLAVIYRLDEKMAGQLYTTVGPDFCNILIVPESASSLRILTADSEAKALYTEARIKVQQDLKRMLELKLNPRGIIVEDILLKEVHLPTLLLKAIEMKAQAEQDAMKMEFVIQKEQQEAHRKEIEAKGIAAFQSIVTEGISPELLQWKGIEATEELAKSTNTKLVIMGNTHDGLPVLLSQNSMGP